MADITKPDANPVLAALLCLILELGHFVVNGQQKKWVYILITQIVGGMLTCGILGLVILVCSILDAYKTAERLKNGETIGENEYTFVPLFKIIRIIDKSATCKGA